MTNINFNINTASNDIDLGVLITALATILAVFLTYLLNKKLESIKIKNAQFDKIISLIVKMTLLDSYLNAYKENINKKPDENNITFPEFNPEFFIDINEYWFLLDYNLYYLNLLDIFNRRIDSLKSTANTSNTLFQNHYRVRQGNFQNIQIEDIDVLIDKNSSVLKDQIKGLDILLYIFYYSIYKCVIPKMSFRAIRKLDRITYKKDLANLYPNYQEEQLYKVWIDSLETGSFNRPNLICFICSFFMTLSFYLKCFWNFLVSTPEKCPKRKDKNDKN